MSGAVALVVSVNGRKRTAAAGSTLESLLVELDRDPRTVAVEHNGRIVRRDRLREVSLRDGDQVEMVQFVQGG